MKKYTKSFKIILLILLGYASKTNSQDNYKLHFKDYHSAQITDIIPSTDKKRILTIDATGKILSFFTKDFSFDKIIKKADGFFIESPRLINNGKRLLYKSKDSLWLIDGNAKVSYKNPFKGRIISPKNNDFIILTAEKDFISSEIGVFNKNFQFIKGFNVEGKITLASVSKDTTRITYIEERLIGKQELVYKSLINNTVLSKTQVEKSDKILHLFFNEKNDTFYAITFSEKEKMLSIYSYKEGVRAALPEIKTKWIGVSPQISDSFLESKHIIISDASSFIRGLLSVKFVENKFSIHKIETENGIYSTTFLKNENIIITANSFNKGSNDIATFSVYNASNNKGKRTYPSFNKGFFRGFYLPDDSFVTYGLENQKLKIKYFTKGTFYNKFHSLDFEKYLEIKHKVSFSSSNFLFDKKAGLITFYGYDLSNNERYIFNYNFIKDKINKLHKIKQTYFSIIDYESNSKKLLLSPERYYNSGYTKPQPFAIVKGDKIKEIKGRYKFAKFSKDAKHILTINDKDVAQIRDENHKIVFEEQLKAGSYLALQIDDCFVVSNSFQQIEYGKCNKENTFFYIDENKNFTSKAQPCVFINDVSLKADKFAISIEDYIVSIGNKTVPDSFQKSPLLVSFNNDATKIMISYADGKISIIETETFKEVGGMFHPSEKEHIFYDTKNHYFSNTNADDFLSVTKDNEKVSLQKADQSIFKPQEVLKAFGEPNQEYLTLLNKAISLRKSKKDFNEIKPIIDPSKTNISGKKGDLYVLSIGVSKYKQAAYNLTFADKDAFDIANI